jgi:GT2 family glycosyltransferase
MISVSVIIGTYNHLPYLKLCLFALERQTFRDFEVIIADDGSGPEVGEWLARYRPSFPVRHLWQEDMGFRKCRILNRSIKEARGEYIVFLDADCIVARDFLQAHWKRRAQGVFLGGRRVMMDRSVSRAVTRETISSGRFDGFSLWGLYRSLRGRLRYYEETLRILNRIRGSSPFSLLGCNFSIHRSDLLSVNGFDEGYEHRGGGEDTDISLRLTVAGKRMRSVRYLAVQFHLDHEKIEEKTESARLFEEKKEGIKTAGDARDIKSSLAGDGGREGAR